MTVVLVVLRQSYIGLSSDAKPNATAGSTFYETDTGATYIFDALGNWASKPPVLGYATIPIPLGKQLTDALPPRAAPRARDYSIVASFPLELIGKDAMTAGAGKQSIALPTPAPARPRDSHLQHAQGTT